MLLERPDTPPKLAEVCKRMMAKEPEERYQSAQAVSAALAPWCNAPAAAVARPPLAVKPLEEAPLPAGHPALRGGAEDWLFSLGGPSTSRATSEDAKTPTAAAKLTKSGKQPVLTAHSSGGMAVTRSGGHNAAKPVRVNSANRLLVAVVGGIVLLAAAAGLASLSYLLSGDKPALQRAAKAKTDDKQTRPEDDADSSLGKSIQQKLAALNDPSEKDAHDRKGEVSQKPTPAAEKQQNNASPKPADPAKPAGTAKPAETVKPVAPVKPVETVKPVAPAKPAETVKPAEPVKQGPPPRPVPPPKPVAPPKPVSLDGLAAAVDLPQPGKAANDAVSLGKLDLDPRQTVELQLLGGDLVAKGNPKFELQKDAGGATPGWSVQIVEKNKDVVKVARVWPEGNEWKIQWDAEAKDKGALLRYCALQFSCEKKTHFVALSTPKTVPPLLVDVATGTAHVRLGSTAPLPDPSVLRLQVLPLDKTVPKNEIKVLEAKAPGLRTRARAQAAAPVAGNTVAPKGQVFIFLEKERTPLVEAEHRVRRPRQGRFARHGNRLRALGRRAVQHGRSATSQLEFDAQRGEAEQRRDQADRRTGPGAEEGQGRTEGPGGIGDRAEPEGLGPFLRLCHPGRRRRCPPRRHLPKRSGCEREGRRGEEERPEAISRN